MDPHHFTQERIKILTLSIKNLYNTK
uniref:Uncharacterized protein n=1 Tax=Anguilla anguilla TaxID=7936 RepID=A0A0E9PJF7_ANGAN